MSCNGGSETGPFEQIVSTAKGSKRVRKLSADGLRRNGPGSEGEESESQTLGRKTKRTLLFSSKAADFSMYVVREIEGVIFV